MYYQSRYQNGVDTVRVYKNVRITTNIQISTLCGIIRRQRIQTQKPPNIRIIKPCPSMVQSCFGVSLVVGGLEAFGVFVGGVPFSEGFAVGEVVVEVFEDVGSLNCWQGVPS